MKRRWTRGIAAFCVGFGVMKAIKAILIPFGITGFSAAGAAAEAYFASGVASIALAVAIFALGDRD